ncbi:glycosyltransferase family 4 protein [Aquirufa sp.]|jgi:glycosyltransferase involved in cell wall biosynthesis|uniref:glycosyltransferase family 4 protein n=1 Tax=Aquirufa sp. TaxID=2676249 RepID=UPI0037C1A773
MKLLILHNQLWTQYKSVIFQGIYEDFEKSSDELLVLQSSICERSRLNIIDFNLSNFNYTYPYVLLNETSLEDSNPLRTTLLWIKFIFKFKPDVINLTGYAEIGTIVVLVLAKVLGIRTLMTNESIHSDRLHSFSLIQLIYNAYKNVLISLTDGFLSYGLKSNDYLYRLGVKKRQIHSYLNTFDRSKFHLYSNSTYSNNVPYILFVGRLSEEKNIESLINLGRLFKNDNFNCQIKIVGDGSQLEFFKKIVFKEKLPLVLEGAKKWDQLGPIYESATAFILPSLNETWGMVANEALEYGLPVICSSACGCADDLIINGFNGLVIDEFKFTPDSPNVTYFRIKDYIASLLLNDSLIDLNKKISSIYDESKLIKEFVGAFRCVN